MIYTCVHTHIHFCKMKTFTLKKFNAQWNLDKNLITSYLTKSLLSNQLYFWTLYKVFPTLKIHEDHPVTHQQQNQGWVARLWADGLSELRFQCPVSRYTNSRAIFFVFFPLYFSKDGKAFLKTCYSHDQRLFMFMKNLKIRESPKK